MGRERERELGLELCLVGVRVEDTSHDATHTRLWRASWAILTTEEEDQIARSSIIGQTIYSRKNRKQIQFYGPVKIATAYEK